MGKVHREEKVVIERLSRKGCGVGSADFPEGRTVTVEVPFTISGETVLAKLYSKRKGLYRSLLEKFVEASSDRVESRCSHFGLCGGCRWQHLRYERQLELKRDFIQQHFSTVCESTCQELSVIPCELPWNYRNKMEFTFSMNGAGTRFLGLVIDSSRGCVFDVEECHLAHRWFSEVVCEVKRWWETSGVEAYHLSRDRGSLRTLTLREGMRTGDRMVVLTVSGNSMFALSEEHLKSFVEEVRVIAEDADVALSIVLRIQHVAKGVPTRFEERVLYGRGMIYERLHLRHGKNESVLTFLIGPSVFSSPILFRRRSCMRWL